MILPRIIAMNGSRILSTLNHLPKGKDMQGIGETFQVDEFTGSLSLSIPIHVSPCRGFDPYLSLNYNSNSGNGIFGNGFSLSIPCISRNASAKYPQYSESDTFLLSDWGNLVPVSNGQREENINDHKYLVISYQPFREDLFAIIEHWTDLHSENTYWKVVDRENITSIFGKTKESRISDPDNLCHVYQWLLTELFDAKGNRIVYEYKSENSQGVLDTPNEINRTQITNKYIERIRYGNLKPYLGDEINVDLWNFEIVFDYGEYDISSENNTPSKQINPWKKRQDSFSNYQAGFEIRTHRLCRNILMFHRFEGEDIENSTLVHATKFNYSESPIISLLTAIESIGYRFHGSEENKHYEIKKLPPLEFDYTGFNPSNQIFKPLKGEDDKLILGIDLFPKYMLVDLFGEGIPGILYSDGRSALYWEPKGDGKYSNPHGLCRLPIDANVQGMNYRLMDLTGNGQLDLVINTPFIAGYYEVNPDRTWECFKPISSFPIDFNNPGNYWVDAIGHGLTDLLRIENDRILIYPSQGKKGFAAPFAQAKCEDLPLPKQGAVNELIQFADMFGTGGQHLVRISNGLVECWPHLGYGRFGKKVLIANAPYFDNGLDASRLVLADLDGSGTADLIYVNSDHVKIYFNQSGNSFSENPLIVNLPGILDRLNQIEFADIYGNGNRCLIFSENHPKLSHWIYDFCQGKKPYILNKINNNLGVTHAFTYCSSVKYYLEDKKICRPWLFNLPFPVQVVMRTETSDLVSHTNLVSNYYYHHGYYDGMERELCGFGMVERLDADPLSVSSNPYDVHPVLTKTWYHVGAGMLKGDIYEQYSHEYFQGDPLSQTMPKSVFDFGGVEPDDETWHHALRSLTGMVLRKEIYSPDEPATQAGQDNTAPYAVSETNYLVKLIQKNNKDNYGIFFVHPQETINYNYDRNPRDPRIDHEFILKVDKYGNQMCSCSVAYGRRPIGDEKVQEQITPKITCQESIFIPLDRIEKSSTFSSHLPGLLQESRALEIRDVTSKADYFDFEEVSNLVDRALKACTSSESDPSARLLSWQRNYYWGSDATITPILDGKVSPQALLYRSEEAVFSDNEIKNNIFKGVSKIGDHENIDSLLVKDGGYYLDKGLWWSPGLKNYYYDANQFFLPHYTADAFGNITTHEYDRFNLLLTKTTDSLNNQVIVESIDYQALQPQKVLDMNKNAYEVLFDPLGMAAVTSQYSTKSDKPEGFMKLKGMYRELTPRDVKDVIAGPQIYLQGAASYFYYDLLSWKREKIPVHAVSLTAERYPTKGASPIQIQITYSDGLGRVEQVSSKVEPGGAFLISPDGKITPGHADDRWLVSGHKVYNNKGNAARQYEPLYISTFGYIGDLELSKFGVSPTLYYDPLQRLIRVDTPKGFFRKTEFSAWEERYYDENDTVKDSDYYKKNIDNMSEDFKWERLALLKAEVFYNTPEERKLDSLGRVIQDIQINDEYVVDWNKIPGTDDIGLREFLCKTYNIDWINNAEILKSEDQKIIIMSIEDKTLSLELNDEKSEVILKIGDVRTENFAVRKENDEIHIYKRNGSKLITYYALDIEGNLLSSADPRLYASNKQNFCTTYDMTGRVLKTISSDAGKRWRLYNCMGNPIYSMDSRGFEITTYYDALHRPMTIRVKGGDRNSSLDQIVERLIYGDSKDKNGQPVLSNPESLNLRGELYKHYDQAGLVCVSAYNIQRLPLEKNRQLIQDYKQEVNWNDVSPDTLSHLLQSAVYYTEYTYDALGRVSEEKAKEKANTYGSVYWTYHISGRLNLVEACPTEGDPPYRYVKGIEYNARGQRTKIDYGNGITASYDYDPNTFDLRSINAIQVSDSKKIQDIAYSYDPLGNITHVMDRADIIGVNESYNVKPDLDYTYDGLYHLILAKGRQEPKLPYWQNTNPTNNAEDKDFSRQGGNNGPIIQNYIQRFCYDRGGNLNKIEELADDGKVIRTQEIKVSDTSNRAVEVELLKESVKIDDFFDGNGNQKETLKLKNIAWNYRDNVTAVSEEFYVYDGAAKRIHKVAQHLRNNEIVSEESIYLGILKITRVTQGPKIIEEHHSLMVMDDRQCVSICTSWTQGVPSEGVKNPEIRYQLDDHLGSSRVEIDEDGCVTSYEEYFPYGGTAIFFGQTEARMHLKEYRYSGKEKDNTGLYCYGARYYVPWLGRWLNPDPIGAIDGLNLYAFVKGNPINNVDINGFVTKKRKLRDITNPIKTKGALSRKRRAIRSFEHEGKATGRNLMTVTVKYVSKASKKVTFHLRSAGLGGIHPRFMGKSAAHTEQQWRGLVKKGLIYKAYGLKSKPKGKPTVVSFFSTNETCDKNPSMPKGCGGIPIAEMAMGTKTKGSYRAGYKTGGSKDSTSHTKMKKEFKEDLKKSKKKLRRSNSVDVFVDSDQLRDMDIEKMKPEDLEPMLTVESGPIP
jgi:RHS repeat-associated protein